MKTERVWAHEIVSRLLSDQDQLFRVVQIESDFTVSSCIGQDDVDNWAVSGLFNFLDVKAEQWLAGLEGLIAFDKDFKAFAFHIDGVDADVDQNLTAIIGNKTDGMAGWSDHHDLSLKWSSDQTGFRDDAAGFAHQAGREGWIWNFAFIDSFTCADIDEFAWTTCGAGWVFDWCRGLAGSTWCGNFFVLVSPDFLENYDRNCGNNDIDSQRNDDVVEVLHGSIPDIHHNRWKSGRASGKAVSMR